MLSYKELQQLLQPIEPGPDSIPPQQPQNQPIPQKNNPKNGQPPAQPAIQQNNQRYSLNLSHRELRKVPPLIPFKQYAIQSLNLGFNYLKDLKAMKEQSGQFLAYLNISFNFLTTIQKIGGSFSVLKVIDANANRITSVDISDTEFPCLQALYLKNNKIQYFLHCPRSLEILCLDHNQLQKLAFTGGDNLEILSASANKIEEFQVENSQRLAFLDLEQNMISDLQKLKSVISKCKDLLSLNMIGNYVSKISHKKYLVQALVACPKLVKVDEVIINPHVRQAFRVQVSIKQIMSEQDKMEIKMKETQEKYRNRMEQQLRLKQQMLDKLRNEQKEIENNFTQFMRMEKQQLDVLENYAKNNMGKKIMGISQQNKPFNKLANGYGKQPLKPLSDDKNLQQSTASQNVNPLDFLGKKNQQPNEKSAQDLGNQLTKFLVEGIIITKHKEQYATYKKTKQEQRVTKQSKIKKYLGIPEKQPGTQKSIESEDDDSILSDEGDLPAEQKERRKKNMRNPGLVYRNSNQLMGVPNINIDDDLSSEEQTVFNKKCLPYLVKNYGFHTVV